MKVKEIMTRDLAYVRHNQTITEAAEKMKRLKVGDLLVLAGEDAVGMVTDRDVVVRTVAHGLDPKVTHVIDAMTEGVISCKEDDPIQKAAQMMGKHQIRRLPVMNDQNAAGRSLSAAYSMIPVIKGITRLGILADGCKGNAHEKNRARARARARARRPVKAEEK